MGEGLGSGWRAAIDADMAAGLRRHLPWAGILGRPFPVRPRQVERVANLATATPAGRTCSTCTATAPPGGRPDLVYFHGGAFRSGSKHYARPPTPDHEIPASGYAPRHLALRS